MIDSTCRRSSARSPYFHQTHGFLGGDVDRLFLAVAQQSEGVDDSLHVVFHERGVIRRKLDKQAWAKLLTISASSVGKVFSPPTSAGGR